ncbi:MAG: DUF6879 family protein, partial [Rhabdochlamydiaceae bacterium]
MRFPDELFDNFEVSVFRLETLSQYLVDQDIERIAAWKEGKLLPERSIRTSPWLRRISETTRLGKIWSRVHVIDQPLTDYLRFEIASYAQNVSAGEEVRIADRAMSPELDCLRKDFWMLDSETENALVILMDYDADGRFEGW